MNWYLARLLYQRLSREGNLTTQFDEQWRLIRADEREWALEKAALLAQLNQYDTEEEKPQNTNQKFITVVDICEIGKWQDGRLVQHTSITSHFN